MTSKQPSPPRWAESMLRSLLKPSDRESISGDFLEEYRVARRPALGRLGADAWYIKHVLSILWRLIWPCALATAGLGLISGLQLMSPAQRFPGNVSLVQAPGVSIFDALIYLWAGYHASRRTGLIISGTLAAGATSFIGFAVLFTSFSIAAPSLLMAPFSKPFIFVILSALLLLALAAAVIVGTVGGVVGKWNASADPIRLTS